MTNATYFGNLVPKRLPVVPIALIAAFCLTSNVNLASSKTKITFRFNPSNKVTFIESCRTTVMTDYPSLGKQTEVSLTRSRVTITRTKGGYAVAVKTLSIESSCNGQKVNDPLLPALRNVVLVYDLDAQGRLKAIRGIDALLTKVKQTVPASVLEPTSPTLNKKALLTWQRDEYASQIGRFVGRSERIGDTWTTMRTGTLPTGDAVVCRLITKLTGRAKVGGHDCVIAESRFDTGSFVPKAAKSASSRPSGSGASDGPWVVRAQLSGEGKQLIDPATMLTYADKRSQTARMQVEVPGKGQTWVTVQQTEDYDYTYGK